MVLPLLINAWEKYRYAERKIRAQRVNVNLSWWWVTYVVGWEHQRYWRRQLCEGPRRSTGLEPGHSHRRTGTCHRRLWVTGLHLSLNQRTGIVSVEEQAWSRTFAKCNFTRLKRHKGEPSTTRKSNCRSSLQTTTNTHYSKDRRANLESCRFYC